jgi:hypothetical protein
MQLQKIARNAAAVAFNVISPDAISQVMVEIQPEAGAYDPITDTRASSPVAPITVRGMFYNDTAAQLTETQYRMGAVIILQADVEAAGYTSQKIDDTDNVIIAGKKWDVWSVQPDPVAAIYVLKLRRQ